MSKERHWIKMCSKLTKQSENPILVQNQGTQLINICSNITIKTTENIIRRHYNVFIVNFEHNSANYSIVSISNFVTYVRLVITSETTWYLVNYQIPFKTI